ncbi:PREDICTED: agamous-like MADS-box protein AGL62 [Lupinus angustifolius]|uniref:agamous-like MADS-box protein AGL62 n=1 Tax=Lupinus angustifolius TaxID=3871 RepID=UPI00092F15FE|nr:PREDICTED: agamous-like MADS-box protein AGL62 [Lupinus angustifolius]
MSNSNSRRNMGRQKTEMKKITKESNLQVTFTKRRNGKIHGVANGLFKKANERCSLCDTEVALIIFSPSNKLFSFGEPNVDAVIGRYLRRDQPQNLENMHFLEAHRKANVQELNEKISNISNINEALESEKKYSEELAKQRKEAQEQFWWAAPIEEMNGDQLDQFKLALENLKKNVLGVFEKHNIVDVDVVDVDADAAAAIPPPRFFTGGPSSSNNPLQPPPQQFPVYPPTHMLQNNTIFNNNNNIGGYGPAGGFF